MTRKILPYNKDQLGQDTGYYCGPASEQTIASGHGPLVPESVLAAELGTDQGGTDYIGLIEKSLTGRLGVPYRSVYLEQDPPTPVQIEAFWLNLKRSIDAGYGVAMNWVAPPNNRPRGILGTASPSYPNTWIYHYVAAMGYDEDEKAVWVVDSGFWPREYFITLGQCVSLITPKGYAYANVGPVPVPQPVPQPDPWNSIDILARATGLSADRASVIIHDLAAGLKAAECNNVNRIAMKIAQDGHESANYQATEEYASGADYEGRADLGNTQPGDGVRFKGRSWIQITGRHNYGKFSEWAHAQGLVPTPTYFVDNPKELADLEWAGVGSAWYWTVARPDINTLCDNRDLETVTRRINGGLNGLPDRRARYERALAVGDDLLKLLDKGDDVSPELERMIREIHAGFYNPVDSRCVYAPKDDRKWQLHELVKNTDGGYWDFRIEELAKGGDRRALTLIADAANGQARNAESWVIQRARFVMNEIETNTPDILTNYLNGN